MGENLLKDGGLEQSWDGNHTCQAFYADGTSASREIGNIFVPPHWGFWFRHIPGDFDQPEGRDAHRIHDSRRVRSGEKAFMFFSFWRRHDAGLYQRVQVTPNTPLRLTAYMHSWSSDDDNPYTSEGVGEGIHFIPGSEIPPLNGNPDNDAIGNALFSVGIDPLGGTNPLADTVVWGDAAAAYNGYSEPLTVEAVAEADTVTVFLRNCLLWQYKHGDAYLDDVYLEVIGEEPPPPPPPPPPAGGTKLGAHNIQGGSLAFLEAGAATSLVIENWGDTFFAPSNILKMGAVTTVGYDAQAMYYDMQLSPADAAAKFIADCRDTMEWNGWCEYWLGHNEPVWEIDGQINHDGMAWYAGFEIERMKQLDALVITARNGEQFGPSYYRAVIGNFSCGYPPFDLWPSFYPALAVLREYKGLLGLHEYSWGWMWWLTGSYQPDGWEALPEDHGWLTCRWKRLRDVLLEPEGLGDTPIVITECGLDGGISPKPPMYEDVGGAWKSLVDKWEAREGIPDGQQYYAEQLAWYDAKLRADPYVVGATIFTFGAHDGTPWERFDLSNTEALEHLTTYVAQNPTTGFVYPPPSGPSPPPPPPERGKPRVQYERTYVLLPPNANHEWILNLVEHGSWDELRFTIGGSADDSSVGDLDYRRAVAINPHEWGEGEDGTGLLGFYDKYYPGVEYMPVEATVDNVGRKVYEALTAFPFEYALLWQCNPEWAGYRYGSAGHKCTLCSYGCYVTNYASAQRIYNVDTTATPVSVCEALDENDYKAGTCRPLWSALKHKCGIKIKSGTTAEAEAHINNGGVAMIEVKPSSLEHFTLAVKVLGNGDYLILDPLRNRIGTLLSAYAGVESWRLLFKAEASPPPPPPSPGTQHIYGVHEDCNHEAAQLMQSNGVKGWIVWTEGIGCDPNQGGGRDYRPDTQAFGHKAIVRLNHGYGSSGTIPLLEYYGNFAQRARNFVRDSQGIDVVVIGNEQNNPREYPGNDEGEGGQPIEPEQYAACFNLCYHAIKEVKPEVIVIPGAVDGYNGVWGDSREYARRMYEGIDKTDGICVHAYTHGPSWSLIGSEVEFMHPPLLGVNYNFQNFIDILEALPEQVRELPIYLTETNHLWTVNDPNPPDPGAVFGWLNEDTDWIPVMYAFVDGWNSAGPNQQIQCAILYRYPPIDAWVIRGKDKVLGEFVEAMQQKYKPYA